MKIDGLKLTYEERSAFRTLRIAIRNKPQIAVALLSGLSEQAAVDVLLEAKNELARLLEVNRAFISVAAELAKKKPETTKGE